ncbi:hypothetical protein NNJEOMEG_03642 [Fundidesulfovibrio magnetotacticus]|uniref:AMIN domain-containing protein n=1 Tax=Fundidesulfovibrio magnetotacticus TaxID=2730080 RepID=A0A6V8LVK1_9BACT|nr:AMIN domain-containing protein [Fundidesulfovibrio magnetotacticus]GFK95774.1 hypothetical protein NNJEOMEG_03642 [Fundidesulfovibrio magnetotacticus]
MLDIKASGYSRTFYLAAVLTWVAAAGLLFITAVWGGLYGMMDAVMSSREARMVAQTHPEPAAQPGGALHLEPNPFDQPPAPSAPSGFTASAPESAIQALELRLEKLFHIDAAPPAPSAPPLQAAPAREPAPQVIQEVARPEPRKEQPAQPPLIQGETGVIKSVKFEPGDGRFAFTAQTTAPTDKVTYLYLENPRRLAVNLAGAWRYTASRTAEFAQGPIARAAVGEHPDYVRITLHFRDVNAPKPADPVVTKLKDGFSVSLTTK